MGRVVDTAPDMHGIVRHVSVKTKSTILKRLVTKLCLLLEADCPEEPNEKVNSVPSAQFKDNYTSEDVSSKKNTAKTRSGKQIKPRERLDL